MPIPDAYLSRTRIAYLTMEIGLRAEMHCYSGGLGLLAGDLARSAAELGLPMVFVSLVSRQGYVRQTIEADGQHDSADPWRPEDWAQPLDVRVALPLSGRTVWIGAWLHELECGGGRVPVLLLDTDLPENDAQDRGLTDRLYGGDATHRLRQEAVLGIGGEHILRALDFRVEHYHLNEGHAAFLAASLLQRHPTDERRAGGVSDAAVPGRAAQRYDAAAVRAACVFTTHTPVAAGHDRFEYDALERELGQALDVPALREFGGEGTLNMTRLALNLSGYTNAVARRHVQTAREMFPGYRIDGITNGVHPSQWVHPAIASLFDALAADWRRHPETLFRADELADDALWDAHGLAKGELLEHIARTTGVTFDPALPVIGFARRMTGYKRADLLFTDLDRLLAIADAHPFQVVMAGKAHPNDGEGKALIGRIVAMSRELAGRLQLVFLPNYDISLAQRLVAGSDVWLNTPVPPLEASGTSGMKAAFNGVPSLSVMDGWWMEGCEDGITGWRIGEADGSDPEGHAASLYARLEQDVLPCYESDRGAWLRIMKQTIGRLAPQFSSHRMLRDYVSAAYLRR
ncbi:alpha-glucan family phosphorylase [Chitinasiproducens palmae]|uniref:Starch phosphorylase n=1 Tax=Chitinasiproducens palmae TaxID=1770053 RepID=A0A1H2PKL1_9BURK|nr:alpha-glucan family phosphorylase [Chitinasiproducens palmae]SDV46971.1 starch phosphorylase [Chitinasiproducens palmae]